MGQKHNLDEFYTKISMEEKNGVEFIYREYQSAFREASVVGDYLVRREARKLDKQLKKIMDKEVSRWLKKQRRERRKQRLLNVLKKLKLKA